ncbi:MAG: SARP family transcriptional regulator, partial [Eggerthellaceae bacterium]|nr:SARP family transcriptional regulator [Eggerthellaceae bacterium]
DDGGMAADVPPSRRAAALCWGGDDGTELLGGLAREELPDETRLAVFVMLVLQKGSWSDLEAFMPAGRARDAVRFLHERYPLLGIDTLRERYDSLPAPPSVLASAFDKALEGMARQSLLGSRAELVTGAADALLARGDGERACEVVVSMAAKPVVAEWLARRGDALLVLPCAFPAHKLYARTGRSKGDHRGVLASGEAWRLLFLDDRASARALAQRIGFSSKESASARVPALLLLVFEADGDVRRRALGVLEAVLLSEGLAVRDFADCLVPTDLDASAPWTACACAALALERGIASAARWWNGLAGRIGEDEVLAAALPLIRGIDGAVRAGDGSGAAEVFSESRNGMGESAKAAVDGVCLYASKALTGAGASGLTYPLAMLARSLASACESGAVSADYAPSRRILAAVRRMDADLASQCREYAAEVERTVDEGAEFRSTHPDAFRRTRSSRDAARPTKVAPQLRVNLFGGLEVYLGEEEVDPLLLRRQKVKNLLAVLVLNKGREMSRDKLISILWPNANPDVAVRNLYAVWSQLRRALTTPDGSCPYLVRERGGCRMDARLVECDASLFEDTCRMLLFGRPSLEECERLLAVVNERFADDLLPSELENEYIVRIREDYRVRLVDALAAASTRLVSMGEVRGGLWFAREALRRDASREDVYVTLMEAQLAAGQRTAALDTYFSLRRYLAEELGIDPSTKTVRLYREIIEAEDVVDW